MTTERKDCTSCKHCYVTYSEILGECTECELARLIDDATGCDGFEQRAICGRCSHFAGEMSIPYRSVCKARRAIICENILECEDFEDEEELVLEICRDTIV